VVQPISRSTTYLGANEYICLTVMIMCRRQLDRCKCLPNCSEM